MSSPYARRKRTRQLSIEQFEERTVLSIAAASVELSFTGTRTTDLPASSIPDTMGSVGPAHVVELINNSYAVYNKTNGSLITRIAHDAFWNTALAAGGGGTTASACDPRLIY